MWSYLSSGWHWWISLPWNVWLDYTDKIVKICAVVVGGVWAYVRFVKGRLFQTRLEPSVSGRFFHRAERTYLVTTVKLKNVGSSKVDIQQKGTVLEVLGCPGNLDGRMSNPIAWRELRLVPVFEDHDWLEPSETVEDTAMIVLPSETVED